MKAGEKIEVEVTILDSFPYDDFRYKNSDRYCIRMTDSKNDYTWNTESIKATEIKENKKYLVKAVIKSEKESRDLNIKSYFVKNCKFKEV